MAISMATFPALRANAQTAGGIAGLGVGATTVVIAAVVVVGAVAAADNDSGRSDTFQAISTNTNTQLAPLNPSSAATSTNTN